MKNRPFGRIPIDPPVTQEETETRLPWRVIHLGSVVAAFDTVEDAATWIDNNASGWIFHEHDGVHYSPDPI